MITSDTKRKGLITELQCQTYLSQLGYTISVPLGENCRYDFILDVEGKLFKVQVKTCKIDKNGIKIPCHSTHKNSKKTSCEYYDKFEIDFFATYYNDKCYLIDVQECLSQKTLSFEPNSKNGCYISYIIDYEAEKQIKKILNGENTICYYPKQIYQYDLNNNLIATYSSAAEAAKVAMNNIKKQSHINECIRGRINTAYGYKWTNEQI